MGWPWVPGKGVVHANTCRGIIDQGKPTGLNSYQVEQRDSTMKRYSLGTGGDSTKLKQGVPRSRKGS